MINPSNPENAGYSESMAALSSRKHHTEPPDSEAVHLVSHLPNVTLAPGEGKGRTQSQWAGHGWLKGNNFTVHTTTGLYMFHHVSTMHTNEHGDFSCIWDSVKCRVEIQVAV